MNNTLFKVDEHQFLLTDSTYLTKPKYTHDKLKIEYWQSEVNKYSCSLHAVITTLSNQFNLYYTLEERKDILKVATDQGFSKKWGWTMVDASKCVVDWTNKNKAMHIKSIRISWKLFRKVAYLGYCIVTGFHLKEGFNADKFDDGVLNFSKGQYGADKYGHLLTLASKTKFGIAKQLIAVDNYKDKSRMNNYEIKHSIVKDLVANGILFPSGFIYTN